MIGPLFAPRVDTGGHLAPLVPGTRAESPYRGVVGTVTATPCDERCFYAEGPQCSCSCGGINHGKGHHSAGILFTFSR